MTCKNIKFWWCPFHTGPGVFVARAAYKVGVVWECLGCGVIARIGWNRSYLRGEAPVLELVMVGGADHGTRS